MPCLKEAIVGDSLILQKLHFCAFMRINIKITLDVILVLKLVIPCNKIYIIFIFCPKYTHFLAECVKK